MKLKNMPLEEIQILSYTDLTYMILKENKKPMTTLEIFKEICSLLNYSEDAYADKIDKRFLMLDSGEWDVRDHHSIEMNVEEEVTDDEDEEEDETMEEDNEVEDALNEEIEDDMDTPLDDDVLDGDDDLDDLNIVVDEELEDE